MSKNRGKKTLQATGKKPAPPQRRQPKQVQKISPLALAGGIGAALIIAAILLFVINSRLNGAATPATSTATPNVAGVVPTIATSAAGQTAGAGVTLLGGFSKGNAQAKVTFTEFADYK